MVDSAMSSGCHATKIPFWRMILDQGAVTQEVIDYPYPGEGTTENPYVISWIPNDPRNALDFSEVAKWSIMLLVSLVTFDVALVSSAYSGSTIEVIKDFGVSEEVCLLGVSLFVLGFAIGPLFWAPASEFIGRRYVFLISGATLTAFIAGAAGSQNIQTLIILRFLGGSFGSAPMAVSGGVIADTFPAISRGLAGGLFCTAPFLGPTVGPIVGGFLGESAGWRWVEGLLAAVAGVLTILTFLLLPETNATILLRKRAARLQKITGRVHHSKLDDKRTPPAQAFKGALVLPWVFLFKEPIVFLLSLYMAIIYGILYLLFAAYPIVFQIVRGWSEGKSGLAFLGILVGILIAEAYTFPIFIRYKKKSIAAAPGLLPPEARLPDSFLGAIALPAGLFWFAWTSALPTHWMAPVAAGVPFGFGMVSVFIPVFNYLIDTYTVFAASILAASLLIRSIFGTVFPIITVYIYRNMKVGWAGSIPAFMALACAPIPFLFYKFGPQIRKRCEYSAKSEEIIKNFLASQATPPPADKEATEDKQAPGSSSITDDKSSSEETC